MFLHSLEVVFLTDVEKEQMPKLVNGNTFTQVVT